MHDMLTLIIFYAFAALAVLSAILVITQNNPVRCVLFLVLTFFASSVLWILVEAEFLALILVLVYVGAVMTLFLFVVMMLNIDQASMRKHFMRYIPFGLLIVAFLTWMLLLSVPKGLFESAVSTQLQEVSSTNAAEPKHENVSNTEALGLVLYTDYFLAFELAAAILLVAIVSAITLVHRGAVRSKRQNIRQQIMTRPEDRVQLIAMQSEK